MNERQETSLPPRLKEWIDDQSAEASSDLERTWELAELAGPDPIDDAAVDEAWKRLEKSLDTPTRREQPTSRPDRAPVSHMRRRRIAWGIAASIVMLVGLALYFYQIPVTINTPHGERLAVTLPDGSEVYLNSGSELSYGRGWFGWNRNVNLQGEAHFDVVQGSDKFLVNTFNARVEVLGTRFNVRARQHEQQPATEVALAEGTVRFFGDGDPDDSVVLAPGQRSRVEGDGGVPTSPADADISDVLAWRTGALAFTQQPLGLIIDELERRFNVSIRARPAEIRRDSLSLFMPEPASAEHVLRDICRYRGYECQFESDTILIQRNSSTP